MPRLPDVQSLGQRQIPSAPVQLTGALSADAEAAGQMGEAIADSGLMMQEAAARAFTRQDAVERVKISSSFESFASETLEQFQTERDISDLETVREYGKALSEKQAELLSSHRGSFDSRAQLEMRLEDARARFSGEIAGRSLKAQTELADQYMTEQQSRVSAMTYDDPNSYEAARELWRTEVQEMSGAYTEAQTRAMLIGGDAQIAKSAVQGMLDRGDYDNAESFLMREDIQGLMSPDVQRQIRSRITVQRIAEQKENDALASQQRQYEAFLGRPLTQIEKLKMLNIEPERGPVTFAQQIGQIEQVLGRSLSEGEVLSAAKISSGGSADPALGNSIAGLSLGIMEELVEGHIAGILTPQQERRLQNAVTHYTQPRTMADPETGLPTTIKPELPPFMADALAQRPFPGREAEAEAEPGPENPGPLEIGSRETFYDRADKFTGVGPAVASGLRNTPFVGGLMPESFGDITRTRQELPIVIREIVTALRSNPRFAEGERKDIEADLAINPAIFDNPAAFKDRLIGIDDALALRERNARAVSESPRASLAERQKANDILDLVMPVRAKLGVPPFVSSVNDAQRMLEAGLLKPGQQIRTPGGVRFVPDMPAAQGAPEDGG